MTRLDDINKSRTTPYVVAVDDLLYGDGSTQDTIEATSTDASPIIDFQSNSSEPWKTAVVENMIIDGEIDNQTSAGIGIRLRDVFNGCVRNVTIMNCDVGIQIDSTSGHSSDQIRLEHIRMLNVRQGIQITGADNNTEHKNLYIDDVGISLNDSNYAVGIQLGNYTSRLTNLSNAFIKANVWLGNAAGSTGMYIYGKVKYSLIHLGFEKTGLQEGEKLGYGVQIASPGDYNVWDNQSFCIAPLNQDYPINPNPNQHQDIINLNI